METFRTPDDPQSDPSSWPFWNRSRVHVDPGGLPWGMMKLVARVKMWGLGLSDAKLGEARPTTATVVSAAQTRNLCAALNGARLASPDIDMISSPGRSGGKNARPWPQLHHNHNGDTTGDIRPTPLLVPSTQRAHPGERYGYPSLAVLGVEFVLTGEGTG